jgi:hypothetical protein
MKFKMTVDINMDNAAFEEHPYEAERIVLHYVKMAIFPNTTDIDWYEEKALFDANGNKVGYALMEVTDA